MGIQEEGAEPSQLHRRLVHHGRWVLENAPGQVAWHLHGTQQDPSSLLCQISEGAEGCRREDQWPCQGVRSLDQVGARTMGTWHRQVSLEQARSVTRREGCAPGVVGWPQLCCIPQWCQAWTQQPSRGLPAAGRVDGPLFWNAEEAYHDPHQGAFSQGQGYRRSCAWATPVARQLKERDSNLFSGLARRIDSL